MRNKDFTEAFKNTPNEFGTIDMSDYPGNDWCRVFKPERSVMNLFTTATMFARIWIGKYKSDGHLEEILEAEMNKLLYSKDVTDLGPNKNFVTYVGPNMVFIFSQSIQDHKKQYWAVMDLLADAKIQIDMRRANSNITKNLFEDYQLGLEIWQDRVVEIYDDSEHWRLHRSY